MNPQEEVSRAWENIKLISNPAWVTKSDDFIKANQRLWSWKCAQECHEHLCGDTFFRHLNNNGDFQGSPIIDISCRLRSVKDTIPQSRLARYYGNFYYDEAKESLYVKDSQAQNNTQPKPAAYSEEEVTESWMLPEVDYWYKMLTENDSVYSSQESKSVVSDVSISTQKADTVQQVTSQMSIMTTSIYETSCLFNEKIFSVYPRERHQKLEASAARGIQDVPKWMSYLDQIYPDLELSLHFLRKIPFKSFSLHSTQPYDQNKAGRGKLQNKFQMQLNSEEEKILHENLNSSYIQNIWKCDYCYSKNCTERSHTAVKKPEFYITPESINALQKSILDFKTQIINYRNSESDSLQRSSNEDSRKIRHDKRRFKNKALNRTKNLKEPKHFENDASKSINTTPDNFTENKLEENCPNQILKEFFDHFRNSASRNLNSTMYSNQFGSNYMPFSTPMSNVLVYNQTQILQNDANIDASKLNDKTMKSVSSQTYSNEMATNRQHNNKTFKNNKNNQNKARRKVASDKNISFCKYGSYSPKASTSTAISNTKNDSGTSVDTKKANTGDFNHNGKTKNGLSAKKKSSAKRKSAESNVINENDKSSPNSQKKITILNKSQAIPKSNDEEKHKKLSTVSCSTETDGASIYAESDLTDVKQRHNFARICAGEPFMQNFNLPPCNENRCEVFKDDPVLSYRKRLYSDVLSGNSSVLLLNSDSCNLSQINHFRMDETKTINKTQCNDLDFNPMLLLNNSPPPNILDMSSIEAQLEKLEIEALEQYKTSDESIDKKFEELEKEAIAQYVETSDSYTSCKDESESANSKTPQDAEVEPEKIVFDKKAKESNESDKNKPVNSFVIYSKISGNNKKSKNVKKSKTQK